ncbi:response regulator [Chitinophaga silvatica]|uniref:histidine kinase n=1 Tax=Chitinophaga silvatica TaxID=2282649 RepID=A0A3E1YHG9_9BACT|nr:ATP-binding protein [Chitinophaga silvatica]RFS26831.1 response regulator [Chitinophaga silvatica]
MYTSQEKAFVRYAMLTIMVIVLLTFFMIIMLRKKESQQLGIVVQNLTSSSREAEHIDKSIQLLYSADNSFRLYTITYNRDYLRDYTQKLQLVGAHIDTAMQQENKSTLTQLLVNKQHASEMFLHTKRYVDSLLTLAQSWDTTALMPVPLQQLNLQPALVTKASKADTLITSTTVESKNKKALFGRIREAISNKPKSQTSKQVVIAYQKPQQEKAFTNSQLQHIQQAYSQFIKNAAASHQQLKEKEYALVTTNERLFSNLLSYLTDLQLELRDAENTRQSKLKAAAQSSLYELNQHTNWEVPLILLLAGIIIFGIIKLYRYDLALLKSKRQAERLAQQKSDFAATISHEIRTPVQSLIGYSRLLGNEEGPYITAIQHSAEMLLQVVNNVLDYSRMEAKEPILKKEKFSPRIAIEDVTDTLAIHASEKGLKFSVNIFFPSNMLVMGDSFRLKQIITNLTANAIKYTESGEVNITAYLREGNLLQVSVKDTGPGISHKELPLVFNAFTQGKNHYQKGSGLGLHITKKIVELHNGKIQVESLPGKGTTFSFEIHYTPVTKVPATKKIIVPVANTTMEPFLPSNIRLLIVEDSILNQKLLTLMLNKLHASFVIVSSAEEALNIYQQEAFDFILTDIDLPGIDGLMLTQLVRALPDAKKAAITIIAITGNVLEDDIALYLRSGMNDYIMKPYREEDILEKINRHHQTA